MALVDTHVYKEAWLTNMRQGESFIPWQSLNLLMALVDTHVYKEAWLTNMRQGESFIP